MPTTGVDIDQYILLILYPSIVFFLVGYVAKKRGIKKPLLYLIQSIVCFVFSISYYLYVPQNGAFGLALILGLFGILLLVLARKEKINPSEENEKEKEEKKEQ
ncbi:MAG TPA: hypothetical protein VIY08_14195 [Candidatus Nitrosocosmicus sp.]